MSKLTLYFPDALEHELRKGAKNSKKSLSSYLAGLLSKKISNSSKWPQSFFSLYGSWSGDFPEITDHPPSNKKEFKD